MASDTAIFKEACNGFGFEEIEQTGDGIYCTGCLTTHKRPIKMYSNSSPGQRRETLCRYQVIRLYNPEN